MADLITDLDAARIRANLAEVRDEVAAAAGGREVEILAATKYVPLEGLDALVDAGIELAGENRAQDLERKAAAQPQLTWDFIGHLQSRKVRDVLPHVRYIHSVASDSVLAQLERHGTPRTRVLIEVNVAGEESKSGIAPADLPAFVERCPVEVVGLMTMPPFAPDPEASRPYFASLRELAHANGLHHLSMGTTQDFAVAVQEGATIVRIGNRLYR